MRGQSELEKRINEKKLSIEPTGKHNAEGLELFEVSSHYLYRVRHPRLSPHPKPNPEPNPSAWPPMARD